MSTQTDRTPPEVTLRVGDQKLTTGSGGTFDHVNPATGEVDATIPLAGQAEIDLAVTTAQEAFGEWSRTAPAERRRMLLALADLLEANAEEFSRLGALDNGTPVTVTAAVPFIAADWTRYYAGWADKLVGEVSAQRRDAGELAYTLAQPYGVIGMVITWNAPLASLAMKVPAALAAGNTVVVKPSEMTPFSADLFVDLVEQAGIPAGVVNVLTGTAEAGQALVGHPLVRKISFTGGPATARKILETCAASLKPTVMELGGKSANIICADADLDAACYNGAFLALGPMSGQGCAFPTRMLVQDSVYDDVLEQVVGAAATIPIGDPFDPANLAGPVVNQAAVDRILAMIDRARADGARLLCGGGRMGGDLAAGFYLEPTVFADVDPDSELAQDEVFGPVLAVSRFSSDDEAIQIANNTRYGLSGYVQTSNLARGLRFAEEMITGEVLINGAPNVAVHRPFGGLGASGFGKEGGRAGLDEFLRVKSVAIA